MAKARRKRTTDPELVRLQAELDEELRRLGNSGQLQDLRKSLAAAQGARKAEAQQAEKSQQQAEKSRELFRATMRWQLYGTPWSPKRKPLAAPVAPIRAKVWIPDELVRMKAAGEIPARVTDKTALAKDLAERMAKAHETDRSIRCVGWQTIRNHHLKSI